MRAHVFPVVRGNELVDVVKALIVTHVNDNTIAVAHGNRRALVLEATQRRALYRRLDRVERVDLHHPAEAIFLVAVIWIRQVETFIKVLPAVTGSTIAKAVTLLLRRCRPGGLFIGRSEVAVEILLAGEIGTPGGVTAGTVVDRTQSHVAVGSSQQLVAGRRPTEVHRRINMDAAAVFTPQLAPTAITRTNSDDRNTVSVLRQAHILKALGCFLAKHMGIRAKFMIDAEHAVSVMYALLSTNGEEPHTVMADTNHLRLLPGRGSFTRVSRVFRATGLQRAAPRDQRIVFVVHRHTRLRPATCCDRNGFEIHKRAVAPAVRSAHANPRGNGGAEKPHGRQGQPTGQHASPFCQGL